MPSKPPAPMSTNRKHPSSAAGFQTTEYILRLAAAQLWKDIEQEDNRTKINPGGPHE
jgi:hypothetical protein